MIAIPSRHKSLTLLATIVVAQVLLLAVQIKRDQQVRLIRVWAVELISPIQRAGSWSIGGIVNGWGGYVGLRHARQENEQLRAELGRLKIRNSELEGSALEAERLGRLLKFQETHDEVPMLAARVIGASPGSGSLVVYVDRGSRHGLRRDMGVITPDGVVGKVLAVFNDTSQILLLGDKESGVGALLSESRAQGAVKGTGEPDLSMNYVSNDQKVSVGETILTSGQDRIFPKDLPVGTVVEAEPDRRTPFMRIRVKPAARLDRLEEVLVLLTRQELDLTEQAEQAPQAPQAPQSNVAPARRQSAKQPPAQPAKQAPPVQAPATP